MRKLLNEKYERIIIMLVFALIPSLACLFICVKDGIHLNDIYLPNSQWNDEVFYYQMIAAIEKYNGPLGFFGYNESCARIGGLGPWSPALLIFHVLYAKVFGWTLLSPIYCNILLMTIAMFLLAYAVKPTKRQTAFIGLLYLCTTIITRYVLSGVMEVATYALIIIFLGISIKVYLRETFFKCDILALNLIIFLLVLMRPYWVLLFMIPAYIWYENKNKRWIIFTEAVLAMVSIGGYFVITSVFCAPYFTSIIHLEWMKLLFSSPLHGIYNIIYILISNMWKLLQGIGDGIIEGMPTMTVYVLFFVEIIYMFQVINQKSSSKKKRKYMGYWLFCFLSMLLAVFYLYDNIYVGSRHVMGFVLLFAFLLAFIESSKKKYILFLSAVIWSFCIRATDTYTYQIPVYTQEKEDILKDGKEDLKQADIVDLYTDNPWDNTVIWEAEIDYTYLYAIPRGIGINLCFTDYVLSEFTNLQSKYIMVNAGGEVDLLCEQSKKELIAEYGNAHLWRLR